MKAQNKEVYCTKLAKPGERTQKMSSQGLTKLSTINIFVLQISGVFISLHAILWYYPLRNGI